MLLLLSGVEYNLIRPTNLDFILSFLQKNIFFKAHSTVQGKSLVGLLLPFYHWARKQNNKQTKKQTNKQKPNKQFPRFPTS